MRAPLLLIAVLIAVLAAGCRGSTRGAEADGAPLRATMDTATARRLCAGADSVLAGQKQCDLRDQGISGRGLPIRPE